MVSVIHQGSSFRRVLNYNENKVKEGVATCIEAGYYTKEAADLSFNQKLDRLQKQAALRPTTKVNTVHISLNFDPSERHSQEQLRAIAASYLDKIGFAEQPYLLYEHMDAAHPHVHILTTNIQADGNRIGLHNLGKIQSEVARKQIEEEFNLVKAEDSMRRKVYALKPINTAAEYGKTPTKQAITRVLDRVLHDYKFSSLTELNAVLHLFNVSAERGSEDSRVYKNNGLLYRIREPDGALLGVPIKASDFFLSPTLKKLESDFFCARKVKLTHKPDIKMAIDLVLAQRSVRSLQQFKSALEKEGIHLAISINKAGLVYGLTYVDHNTRCVFKGSDIGTDYSARAILARWTGQANLGLSPAALQSKSTTQYSRISNAVNPSEGSPTSSETSTTAAEKGLLETLSQSENTGGYVPYELSGRAKKKRKKRRSIHD